MDLNKVSAGNILKSKGLHQAASNNSAILAAELRKTLETCIDESIVYKQVAAAIKNGIYVFITGPYTANILVSALRPSIYNEVIASKNDYVDLVDIYNDGSSLSGNPFYYNKDRGVAFYLKDYPGFAEHVAGHFLEKAVFRFSSRHPECTVRIRR